MSPIPDMVALRRELHAHPELSLLEFETADRVEGWLRDLGLRPRRIAKTGLTAMLGKKRTGPTILVRADMDALPIHEATGLPFASGNAGVMHACGHDCHMAALLGATGRLIADPPRGGRAKLLFQPGEEGANGMGLCIDAGILERPTVDAAVGVHVWQWERVGRIGLVRGPCMAAIDTFDIRIIGRGGHAAYPHEAIDPVLVAAHIVTALQSVVSRSVDPQQTAVVTVGSIRSGEANNVIPDEALLRGTARTFDAKVGRAVARRIERIAKDVAKAFGARADVEYTFFLPATVNDGAMFDRAWAVAEDVVGKRNVVEARPSMASEDMSLALARVPGVFAFVGADEGTKRTAHPHHHPRFDVSEKCLPVAAGFLEGFVRSYLGDAR
jgi:amidohydrolase